MISNVHSRELPCEPAELGDLLDRIAERGGPLWPLHWPPMILDRPLAVGADGGHGPIRYTVTEYQPGRRLVCRFKPETGLIGTHALIVEPGSMSGSAVIRHELVGRLTGSKQVLWPLAIRWLHDALIEDLLDRAAVGVGHPPKQKAHWSWWVRRIRGVMARKRRKVGV